MPPWPTSSSGMTQASNVYGESPIGKSAAAPSSRMTQAAGKKRSPSMWRTGSCPSAPWRPTSPSTSPPSAAASSSSASPSGAGAQSARAAAAEAHCPLPETLASAASPFAPAPNSGGDGDDETSGKALGPAASRRPPPLPPPKDVQFQYSPKPTSTAPTEGSATTTSKLSGSKSSVTSPSTSTHAKERLPRSSRDEVETDEPSRASDEDSCEERLSSSVARSDGWLTVVLPLELAVALIEACGHRCSKPSTSPFIVTSPSRRGPKNE
mmetsp:Transcript_48868/g.123976  ORF Transcript_48868/g.123976 Transcript_48868/m.123976 type:complete len:267 (-) Transcript_48868:316-1116(-)